MLTFDVFYLATNSTSTSAAVEHVESSRLIVVLTGLYSVSHKCYFKFMSVNLLIVNDTFYKTELLQVTILSTIHNVYFDS